MFNIDSYADQHDANVYVMEPRDIYDACILRVDVIDDRHVAIYSFNASVRACMVENDWSYTDAAEWLLYNEGMVIFDHEEEE